jgi:oligoendopeptidase F
MSEKTLDAMMEAIAAGRPMMVRYLKAKARALGLDKLGFQDLRAPLGRFATTHTWENSREFVLNNFKGSSEALYKLAKDAFDGGWIEAEDRSHKRQGGWCAFLPIAKQSRIFMTHGGGFSSTITLAHELGHAYHNEAMRDLHSAMRQVPMTLAETASTFAESVVRDAALQGAVDDKEKLAILDARLSAAMSFLMDIPSRFSFEKRLHELREEGPLDADKLDETMIECQREWFGDALGTWSPTFWASKLHFHMGGRSFYNFPYSFGYLFSRLVYAQVKADPVAWATKYDELLCDTGWMTAEELSLKHLGLDLTTSEAWTLAITPLMNDLEQFESLI